jgi:glycosyltransferase involved in cell wall biosynthesis
MRIRERYAGTDTFICSYIGTVGMAHGLEVVLRAARQLRDAGRHDVLFLIIGDGAHRKELEAEAAGLGNIRFTGLLPKDEIPALIAASDASLVHLKKNELFATVIPSKLFELMAMNVPIIMGVEGEARNIVLGTHAGEIMEPESADGLVRAIDRIRKNGRASYQGRACVVQNYDRKKLAAAMLDTVISTTRRMPPALI